MCVFFTINNCCLKFFSGRSQNTYPVETLNDNLQNYFSKYDLLNSIFSSESNWVIDSTINNESKEKNKLHYGFSINQSITQYGLPKSIIGVYSFKKYQFETGLRFSLGSFAIACQEVVGLEPNYKNYFIGVKEWYRPFLMLSFSYLNNITEYTEITNSSIKDLANSIEFNAGARVHFNIVKGLGKRVQAGLGILSKTMRNLVNKQVLDKSKSSNLGYIGSIFISYKF